MRRFRIVFALLYGVLLGFLWECASMSVMLLATLVEHYAGTLVMIVIFSGIAIFAGMVACSTELARPLLSILAFRLSAQIAMTLGTGSVGCRHRLPCTAYRTLPSFCASPSTGCLIRR